MSDATTTRMLRPFIQAAPAPMFLSEFFQTPPENFHTSEAVEIDIVRDGEEVAVAITDLSEGNRNNEDTLGTNKQFVPPIFDEVLSLNAFQLLGRDPGEIPFESAQSMLGNALFQGRAIVRTARGSAKLQRKIRRAVELMASQVFQTGKVTLVNKAGVTVKEIDFKAKNAHMATVGTDWAADGTTGDPPADLTSLADTIRTNGLRDPDRLIFGTTAWTRWLASTKVKALFDNRRIETGRVEPEKRMPGATFQGIVWLNNYRFEMWTYNGHFVHPQTGTVTPYVTADHVLMLSSGARLDLTYGAIPLIVPPDSRVLPFLPQRIRNVEGGIGLTTNGWLTANGRTVNVEIGTRPLTIPTEIDSFARLDVIQ